MFYTYRQNNSGGSFITLQDRGIAKYVIVEAGSVEEANARAEKIGLYFNGVAEGDDCSCCGDRWDPVFELEASPEPKVYGGPVDLTTKIEAEGFIHYLDGKIKRFNRR